MSLIHSPLTLGTAGFALLADLPLEPHTLGHAVLNVVIFGFLGIVLTALGFKVFDWIMPKIDVEVELAEKHNLSVAIVMAAVIIGISIVIAAAVG